MGGQGFKAQGYAVDISDVSSIRALHSAVMADHGRLDILVNNAVTRDGQTGGARPSVLSGWLLPYFGWG